MNEALMSAMKRTSPVLVEPLRGNVWDSPSCLGPSIIAKQLNSITF